MQGALCHNAPSSRVSLVRTVHIWPSSCWPKGYEVHGIIRRRSSFNTGRIDHLYHDPHDLGAPLILHYGDLSDASRLASLIFALQPDGSLPLAPSRMCRSHFEMPEFTADVVALGALRLLEIVRGASPATTLLPGRHLRDVWGQPTATKRATPLTPIVPMRRPKSLRFGRRVCTGKGGIFSVAMAFSSTTNRLAVVRRSSPAKSPRRSPRSLR